MLLTNGQALRVAATEIIGAKGARIQTFLEDNLLAAGNGASGGSIEIEAGQSSGELSVHLLGQDGANGVCISTSATTPPNCF